MCRVNRDNGVVNLGQGSWVVLGRQRSGHVGREGGETVPYSYVLYTCNLTSEQLDNI